MAEIFIRQLIDDLDGKPIDTGLGHEVTFSYQAPTIGLIFDLAMPTRSKLRSPVIGVVEKRSTPELRKAAP